MTFQTESRHCQFRFAENGLAHLVGNYFIFRILDVFNMFKTGDRGRYEYIEL